MTGNPLDLGLVGLVQFLPAMLLLFVSGPVADRYDRRSAAQSLLPTLHRMRGRVGCGYCCSRRWRGATGWWRAPRARPEAQRRRPRGASPDGAAAPKMADASRWHLRRRVSRRTPAPAAAT
jgi:hypothetical protein